MLLRVPCVDDFSEDIDPETRERKPTCDAVPRIVSIRHVKLLKAVWKLLFIWVSQIGDHSLFLYSLLLVHVIPLS